MKATVLLLALLSAPAFAQPFEFGGSIGYGIYRDGTVFGAGATAEAGIRNRFAAGAVFGEDLYDYLSGEIRYVYHDGHPFLAAGGTKADIQGQSHTVTYDLLFHFEPRKRRLRFFIAGGAGVKGYVIAGPAPSPQPFPAIATLTTRDEWKLVVDAGGGVKYRLSRRVLARFDFRDYMTTFPKGEIAPAANNTARGIFQQFTPMFGLSYLFGGEER